jgi:hypothetical protein
MAGKDGRSNNWNFILYPESAPENWREIIDETRIEWVESPLHDKDINPTGETKKEHYHITLLYPTNQSYEQVCELVQEQLKQPIPIKCKSVKGSIRYMSHKDSPEKYQYNFNDIRCHGGADLETLCSPTFSERLEIQKDITAFIKDNDITDFADLVEIAQTAKYDEWYTVMMNYSTLSITAYINSRRNKKQQAKKDISEITNEIYMKIHEDVKIEFLAKYPSKK